jgi:hypothetical protein
VEFVAGSAPYSPEAQLVQDSEPCREYWPAGHTAAVALTEPATQKYPAAHGPEQRGVVSPDAKPKRPPGHSPLQLEVVKPEAFPYRPGAHGAVHAMELMSGVEP